MHFAILQTSARAASAINMGVDGRVVAVFPSSFYVNLEKAFVCIGGNTLTNGPLNVISEAPSGTDWGAIGVQVGDPVKASRGRLHVAERVTFSWANAEVRTPPAPPSGWTAQTLRDGLDELVRLSAARLPDQGLGDYILSGNPDSGTKVSDFASVPIRHFRDWIHQSLVNQEPAQPERLRKVVPLLGLGPGLTPSGDDFLGGAMIVLHQLGQRAMVRPIAGLIGQVGGRATTQISLAHLEAAAEGLGNVRLHETINGMVGGKQGVTNDLLSAIDHIGHCSGWDALAGAVTVLRIWLEIEEAAYRHCHNTPTCMGRR